MNETPSREEELKEALSSLSERYGLQGHLFFYIEDDRIKSIGDISITALAPLVKVAVDKWALELIRGLKL